MAVVKLFHNIARVEDWEGTPAGTFGTTGLGGGPGAAAAEGLHYEATQAAQRRIAGTNSERGFTYIHTDVHDFLGTASGIIMGKAFTALSASINPAGTRLGYGDGVSDYYNYQVGDDGTMGDSQDFLLPPAGGYVILPIEIRKSAWHNLVRVGTPDLTVSDMFRMSHNVSATTGAGDSQALDALDIMDDGLFLLGGDGSDTDGTFQDFVDADEGEGLTGAARAGLWVSKGSTFFTYLNHVIGRDDLGVASGTIFTDEFFNIIYPGGFVGPGRNGLEIDLTNAGTIVTLSNGLIAGEGRSEQKVYFDTELEVTGGATDQIAIPLHGFNTGDQVGYSAEGGSDDIGPDATSGEADDATSAGVAVNSVNWYVIRVDDNTIQLSATAADAYSTSPTAEDLTAAATPGENHSLTRKPDTRPDFTVIGDTGSVGLTSVTLNRFRTITMTDAVTLTSCQVVASQQLILGSGTLSSCTLNGPTTSLGEAFVQVVDTASVDGMVDGTEIISGGEGHAFEVMASGTGSLTNVTFTDYFSPDEDTTGGWSFAANTDVSANQITITGHGFVDGDPVFYSDEGGTQIVGLVDQNLYYLEVIDVNTVEVHPTAFSANNSSNRIALTSGSNETHKFYSANAAFFNNTGGVVVLNILGGGTSPTVRNSAGSTTSVVNSVTLEINGVTEGARCYMEAATGGALPVGTIVMQEVADSTGTATVSFNFGSNQPVVVRARSSGIISAAIADDDGVLTDETTVARNRATINDVTIFPTTPVINVDQYYFGGLTTFGKITTRIDSSSETALGNFGLTWEYWDGDSWEALTVITDDLFLLVGENITTFTIPTDWATTTINSQGPYFYTRVRWTAGSMTRAPIANNLSLKVTKYIPFTQNNTITSTGLTVTANWTPDTIG